MTTDYAAAELLETETGQYLDQKPPVLPVCVTEKVITETVIPEDCITTTIVISTTISNEHGKGIAELLPADPLRVTASVITWDQPVVICHSAAQAHDSSNTAANVPNPNGAYLGIQTGLDLPTTRRMWVAATSSTSTRVTVVTTRRHP